MIEVKQNPISGWSDVLTNVNLKSKLTPHRHNRTTEIYGSIYGKAAVHFEGEVLPLHPGGLVGISPEVAYHAAASNKGFTFLASSVPAYDPDDFFVADEVL